MLPSDLEVNRERFLNALSGDFESFHDHTDFTNYWRTVEAEANQTEDIGQLDRWVKDLARDRDKLEAVRARASQAESGQFGASPVLQIILRLLALLDGVEQRLKRRLAMLRDMLGMWVFLAGPGVKGKPPPAAADGKAGKSEEKEGPSEAVLAKRASEAKPKKPTKTKAS